MKKILACGLSLMMITGGMTGCITDKLNEEKDYQENISYVLLSESHNSLAAIGTEHHYIFDLPPTLAKVLTTPLHEAIEGDPSYFFLEPDGQIHGNVHLYLKKEASEEAKQTARSFGFTENGNGQLRLDAELTGTCYSAGDVQMPEQVEQLNQVISVKIIMKHSNSRKALHYALTPITVAADGAIAAAVIGLFITVGITAGIFTGGISP